MEQVLGMNLLPDLFVMPVPVLAPITDKGCLQLFRTKFVPFDLNLSSSLVANLANPMVIPKWMGGESLILDRTLENLSVPLISPSGPGRVPSGL